MRTNKNGHWRRKESEKARESRISAGVLLDSLKDLGLEEMAELLLVLLKLELVLDLSVKEHEILLLCAERVVLSCDYAADMILQGALRELTHTCSFTEFSVVFFVRLEAEIILLGVILLDNFSVGLYLLEVLWDSFNFGTFCLQNMSIEHKSSSKVLAVCRFFVAINCVFVVMMEAFVSN
jgi:hypothetical protein